MIYRTNKDDSFITMLLIIALLILVGLLPDDAKQAKEDRRIYCSSVTDKRTAAREEAFNHYCKELNNGDR